MKLSAAHFVFFTNNKKMISAFCDLDANPVTWKVKVSGADPVLIQEIRSNQFVNQTRAKQIIMQALKLPQFNNANN